MLRDVIYMDDRSNESYKNIYIYINKPITPSQRKMHVYIMGQGNENDMYLNF